MRVLIIGSSMAMPRMEYNYDESWIAMLVKKYPDVEFIDKCRRASTSERLVRDGAGAGDKRRGADLLEYYNPDWVITQIGVTDCAPRLLKHKKMSTKLINNLPRCISNLIYGYVRKHRGRTIENADVSIDEFRKNWENYCDRAKNMGVQILCIKISLPTDDVLQKNPLIKTSIDLYNNVYEDLSTRYSNLNLLTPFTQEEVNHFAVDEFHVGKEGQKVLFNKLASYLDDYFKI